MDPCWQSDVSAFQYAVLVCHSFSSKEEASLNSYTACFYTQNVKSALSRTQALKVPVSLQAEGGNPH